MKGGRARQGSNRRFEPRLPDDAEIAAQLLACMTLESASHLFQQFPISRVGCRILLAEEQVQGRSRFPRRHNLKIQGSCSGLENGELDLRGWRIEPPAHLGSWAIVEPLQRLRSTQKFFSSNDL